MAAVQSQFPVGYRRTQGRTVVLPKRDAKKGVAVAIPDISARSFSVIAVVALVAIIYISGFMRMTAVSYQRSQIMSQVRNLQVKEQLVQTKLTEGTVKEAVAGWADANGMEPA